MKVALLGDTALFGKFSVDKNPEVYTYFSEVRSLLREFDFVVANLETPFINNNKTFGSKSAYIGSSIQNADLLKYIGINIVNLANNHIFDYGTSGYNLTKKILYQNDISFFGTEGKVLKIEVGKNKLAFSGFCCYSTNPVGISKKGINKLNYEEVINCLVSNFNEGYNNILSIHAGQEHVNLPSYDHIIFARKLSEYVPYVYYGHHPHVLQGLEKYNGSLIAYSLGNFCFDDVYTKLSKVPLIKQDDNNKSSIILSLVYEDNALLDFKVIPIFSGDDKIALGRVDIQNKMQEYSSKINLPVKEYIEFRNNLIRSYINNRKKLRDFKWYIERLNLKYIKIALATMRNKRLYYKNFKRYLIKYSRS